MLTEKFISGETDTPRAKAVRGDLNNDVARGILTYRNADTPVSADPDPSNTACARGRGEHSSRGGGTSRWCH